MKRLLFGVLVLPVLTWAAATPYAYVLNSSQSASKNAVTVFNWKTYENVASIQAGNYLSAVAANPNGKYIYVLSSGDSTISVFDTDTNSLKTKIQLGPALQGDPISQTHWYTIAVTPDGKQIWALRSDGLVAVVCAIGNVVLQKFTVTADYTGPIVFSPDGKIAYIVAETHDSQGNPFGEVEFINTASKALLNSALAGDSPAALAVSPDGKSLYVVSLEDNAGPDSGIITINTTTAKGSEILLSGDAALSNPQSLAITPDGKKVYVLVSDSFSMSGYDLYTLDTKTGTLDTPSEPNAAQAVAVTPDGGDYWIAEDDGIEVGSVQTGLPVTFLQTSFNGFQVVFLAGQ